MLYPTASIVLHTRVNRDGLRPIYLRATYRGKSKHFALDMYCAAKDWNDEDRRFSKSADGAKEANDLLRAIEQRAADALYSFKRDGSTNAKYLSRLPLSLCSEHFVTETP